MMVVKVSVIIPVYNVEKYLAECLDSVINQTLKDIEIICVDDCSTDGSPTILEEYKNREPRITVITHERNRGLGAARNTGMEAASGQYVWFVDSDDWIAPQACQLLYDTAKTNDVDVLLFQAATFYESDGAYVYVEDYYYNDLPKRRNFCMKECFAPGMNIPVSACMYISRKDFISGRKFREGVYYEDTDYTPILLTEAKSLRSICFTAYNRRRTPGSIMQSPLTEKKLRDKIEVCKSLAAYISSHLCDANSYIQACYRNCLIHFYGEINASEFRDSFAGDADYAALAAKLPFYIRARILIKRFLYPYVPRFLLALYRKMKRWARFQ